MKNNRFTRYRCGGINKLISLFLAAVMMIACSAPLGFTAYADDAENISVDEIKYDSNFSKFYYSGSPDTGYYYLPILLSGHNLEGISKSDFRFEVDGSEIELDDSAASIYDKEFYIESASSDSAEIHIVFPENKLEAERECSITVLPAADSVKNKVFTVKQDAHPQDPNKIFRLEVDDWYAALVDEGVIMIRIYNPSEGVELNVTPEEVKDYIFFATGTDNNETDIRKLTDQDKVTMEDNVLTIELADKSSRIPPCVIFKSGALRNADGKYLGHRTTSGGNHGIYYHTGANIQKMSYSAVTLTSEGGHVDVTATGINLNKGGAMGLPAKIFRNNEGDPFKTIDNSEITVNQEGTEAIFGFDVPANNTETTVSYRIIPVVNSFNAVPTYIKDYDVISVLPPGKDVEDVTLSSIDFQGESDEDLAPEVYVTTMRPEQFTAKVDMVIRGTNLDSKKAVLKAVDENGIEWPLLSVFECGATFRWQNSAMYLPSDESLNEQHIELLIPRRLGKTHTFTFYVAPDGENYTEDVTGTAVIKNDGLFDAEEMRTRGFTESDFTQLTNVTVKHVDTSGNELAPSETYKAYGITELYHQGIAPKEIEGYVLKSIGPANAEKMLKAPRQLENGQFYFDDGQWFVKDLKDSAGKLQPIVFTYQTEEEAKSGGSGKSGSGNNKADIGAGTLTDKAAQERYNALAAKYAPGKVKLIKAKKGKKRMTLTWKTIKKGVNGYQVEILNKKTGKTVFTKNIKQTRKLKKKKTIKKVIKSKKLKKGRYTVRVRAYRVAEGQTFYGEWSKAKSVKLK